MKIDRKSNIYDVEFGELFLFAHSFGYMCFDDMFLRVITLLETESHRLKSLVQFDDFCSCSLCHVSFGWISTGISCLKDKIDPHRLGCRMSDVGFSSVNDY